MSTEVKTETIRISTGFNGTGITLGANINYPANFDATLHGHYSAIISIHPGGGVKEQCAGLYAHKLASTGLVTIAFDASYQGESSGTPRQLDNPHVRTEDVSSVVDYLTTLPYINPNRIAALGICAGGGFAAAAMIRDHRIAALATVNAVNMGHVTRVMGGGTKDADVLPLLLHAAAARTADAKPGATPMQAVIISSNKEEAIKAGALEGWEYYHDRAKNANAPGWNTTRSLMQVVAFDAFQFAEAFLTQPILAVVGSEAFSRFMSDDLMKRAGSAEKRMYVVEGANHMQVYDKEEFVKDISEELAGFFHSQLTG